ncbi:hypothetical protein Dda_1353 [Drechslerella dactyloides]|uniref:Activator of Hsp90 ATPase AHSA1-like N-terminal domain-containing protein n=1 Tax=Drechslerella dactyloides TaxID=74499 RepID=A0AAD6NKI6_DREDA|nr:hypothetical protein Dda_1353 [Drechslerella dactyloides]
MVLHNPNNWHWVNKDASAWAKDYLEQSLVGVSAADPEGNTVEIVKVLSVEGDVDVSQRKGKVITLFDVKIQLEFKGQTASEESVSGTITIPEVAHDTEPDEYVVRPGPFPPRLLLTAGHRRGDAGTESTWKGVETTDGCIQFDIANYADSKEKQPVRDLVRSSVTPQLRSKLSEFAPALMDQHGKDIQHTKENDPKYRTFAGASSSASSSSQHPGLAATDIATGNAASHHDKSVVNTTDINDSFEFQTSAEQLYQTFVDPQMVAAFTRSSPQLFEPKQGGRYRLFGGNVEGEFVTLTPPQQIEQKWRLSSWPTGHFSTMSMAFDQGQDSTKLRLSWTGVPIGQEETTRKNFEEYYVKSIKLTFGGSGAKRGGGQAGGGFATRSPGGLIGSARESAPKCALAASSPPSSTPANQEPAAGKARPARDPGRPQSAIVAQAASSSDQSLFSCRQHQLDSGTRARRRRPGQISEGATSAGPEARAGRWVSASECRHAKQLALARAA